jgi:hypothetical protein
MISQPVLPGHLIPLGPVQGFPDGRDKGTKEVKKKRPPGPMASLIRVAISRSGPETTRTEER